MGGNPAAIPTGSSGFDRRWIVVVKNPAGKFVTLEKDRLRWHDQRGLIIAELPSSSGPVFLLPLYFC